MHAPSVFNFYGADYSHPILLQEAGLDSPEFEIHNAITATVIPNTFFSATSGAVLHGLTIAEGVSLFRLNYTSEFLELAEDVDTQLDRTNLLLLHGSMSSGTRSTIKSGIAFFDEVNFNENGLRTEWAVYFTSVSPNTAILK